MDSSEILIYVMLDCHHTCSSSLTHASAAVVTFRTHETEALLGKHVALLANYSRANNLFLHAASVSTVAKACWLAGFFSLPVRHFIHFCGSYFYSNLIPKREFLGPHILPPYFFTV